jgi:hypothetical protein
VSSVNCPALANGNVYSADKAARVLDETGARGLMMDAARSETRGSLSSAGNDCAANPSIFLWAVRCSGTSKLFSMLAASWK